MTTIELPRPVIERYHRVMNHAVRPGDIVLSDIGHAPPSSFGKSETEKAAGNLIRFFSEKGYWAEFEVSEFKTFCEKRGLIRPEGLDDQLLYGLTGTWV